MRNHEFLTLLTMFSITVSSLLPLLGYTTLQLRATLENFNVPGILCVFWEVRRTENHFSIADVISECACKFSSEDKKGQFWGDDGTFISRKDYADGPMVEYENSFGRLKHLPNVRCKVRVG